VKPVFDENNVQIYQGDCRTVLATLPSNSVNCVVTSPPYWGLRDYGCEGQIGLEQSPEAYVAEMVAVFDGVWRVLRDDGTLWLNLGDSYSGSGKGGNPSDSPFVKQASNAGSVNGKHVRNKLKLGDGMKPKDLVGIPWRVAFALQAAGWYLRQDIIWHKPNPMPESCTDRCTKSHEYIFLLSKSERYHYNADAIAEESAGVSGGASFGPQKKIKVPSGWDTGAGSHGSFHREGRGEPEYKEMGVQSRTYDRPDYSKRNKRSVWTVATHSFPEAHFATFPPNLITPCIKAGVPDGGVCLDPFFGAGTTGLVCQQQHVKCIGIELNPKYIEIAARRLSQGVLSFTQEANP
jgi:site-specific DNA-methyltransferase (adenine-specific)